MKRIFLGTALAFGLITPALADADSILRAIAAETDGLEGMVGTEVSSGGAQAASILASIAAETDGLEGSVAAGSVVQVTRNSFGAPENTAAKQQLAARLGVDANAYSLNELIAMVSRFESEDSVY
ncbi:MAG: hypothetical protein D6688_09050 [Alphaproteobacteria bacterium]|nr:MAG: hypothetical protein D6688_09050 [Alphaproteobacteria bacterium]